MWFRLQKDYLERQKPFTRMKTSMCVRSIYDRCVYASSMHSSEVLARFTWRLILFDAKPCDIECRQKDEREQRRSGQSTHDRIC